MPLVPVAAVAVLKRRALRQGVFGQSSVWKAVAVVVFGGQILRRLAAKRTEVVLLEELRPGESMQITPLAPSPERARRRARRPR